MSKILIVDDSSMVRQQISGLLKECGYVVIEAFDGAEAFEKLQELKSSNELGSLSLVLCDVNMPRLNGIGLLEKVAADPSMSDVPFVMVTTEGSVDLIREAKKAGAKGWIIKPFKPETIISIAKRFVGLPSGNAAAKA